MAWQGRHILNTCWPFPASCASADCTKPLAAAINAAGMIDTFFITCPAKPSAASAPSRSSEPGAACQRTSTPLFCDEGPHQLYERITAFLAILAGETRQRSRHPNADFDAAFR